MTKLEKSIRKEMNEYRIAIRTRHLLPLGATGIVPENYGFFRNAYATVKDGICESIRVYVHGDAYERRDYNKESIEITKAVERAVREYPHECTWDEVIEDITEILYNRFSE